MAQLIKITILLCLIWQATNAQNAQFNYAPLAEKPTYFSVLKGVIKQEHEAELKSVPQDLDKKVQNELKAIYENRNDRLYNEIKEGYYISDSSYLAFVHDIYNEIINNNNEFHDKKPILLISKYSVPNAFYRGQNIIVFNIGLLACLENKDQIAFILGHELSHYWKNHLNGRIQSEVLAYMDKKTKEQLKKAAKSKYGSATKVLQIIKNITFDNRKHSRLKEKEADSLSIHFLKNTGFSLEGVRQSLTILDSLDTDKYYPEINLKKFFHFKDYPFKESWLVSETRIAAWVDDETIQDSLKTHPDCQKRIKWAEKEIEQIQQRNSTKETRPMEDFILQSQFEIVESEYFFKRYGYCLYKALILSDKHPDNFYLKLKVAQCLHKIHAALNDHKMSEAVSLPAPFYPPHYNSFLQFINNLRLTEISQIAYYFLNQIGEDEILQNEELLFNYILSAKTANKTEVLKKYKAAYIEHFPKGKYLHLINTY